MKQIIKNILFWLDNARFYSTAMTFLSWLVAFLFAYKNGGNIYFGVIALFGILLVHLSTNLLDDYFDYKILVKDENFISSAQDCKCKYLKTNQATLKDLKNTIIIMLSLAALIGGILFILSGYYVFILAVIALIVALTYQPLSIRGLGEICVIFAYGPLMFEGVYYVMTKSFSLSAIFISLACSIFVNTVLYVHMLMDYDGDTTSHKTTLCRKFNSKNLALNFLWFFYLTSYFMILCLTINLQNYLYLTSFLMLPFIINLYNLLKQYNIDKQFKPNVKFWHYPLENWDKIKDSPNATFYFLFYYSRNIVTYFMLLISISIIFK